MWHEPLLPRFPWLEFNHMSPSPSKWGWGRQSRTREHLDHLCHTLFLLVNKPLLPGPMFLLLCILYCDFVANMWLLLVTPKYCFWVFQMEEQTTLTPSYTHHISCGTLSSWVIKWCSTLSVLCVICQYSHLCLGFLYCPICRPLSQILLL